MTPEQYGQEAYIAGMPNDTSYDDAFVRFLCISDYNVTASATDMLLEWHKGWKQAYLSKTIVDDVLRMI